MCVFGVNSLGSRGRPVDISRVAGAEGASPHDLLRTHGTRIMPCILSGSFKSSSRSSVSI